MMMPNNLKVYFYTKPVDMRKGINGLSLFVADRLELDPLSGHLYLFANTGANKIKALYWQKNGFCLWYKILEKGRLKIPKNSGEQIEITISQLNYLLDGLDINKIKPLGAIKESIIY